MPSLSLHEHHLLWRWSATGFCFALLSLDLNRSEQADINCRAFSTLLWGVINATYCVGCFLRKLLFLQTIAHKGFTCITFQSFFGSFCVTCAHLLLLWGQVFSVRWRGTIFQAVAHIRLALITLQDFSRRLLVTAGHTLLLRGEWAS